MIGWHLVSTGACHRHSPKQAFSLSLRRQWRTANSVFDKLASNGPALDFRTVVITGTLKNSGDFIFIATVANAAGKASAQFQIVCGESLALTPPMGSNSYDAFGDNVV